MQHKLIAFIGGGNMAQAIILGLLKQGYPAEQIIVNDPNEEKEHFLPILAWQLQKIMWKVQSKLRLCCLR